MPVTRGEIQRKAEQRVRGEDIRNLPSPVLQCVGLTHDDIRRHARGERRDMDVMAGLERAVGYLEEMQAKFHVVIESFRAQKPVHQPTENTTGSIQTKRKVDQMASDETTDRPAKKLKGKEPVRAPTQAEATKATSCAAVPVAGLAVPYPQEMEVDSQQPASSASALPTTIENNSGCKFLIVPSDRPRIPNVARPPTLSPTPDPPKPRTLLPTSRPKYSGGSASNMTSTSGASKGPTKAQKAASPKPKTAPKKESPQRQTTMKTASPVSSAPPTQTLAQAAPAPVHAPVPTSASVPASASVQASASAPVSVPSPVSAPAPAPAPAAAAVPVAPFRYRSGPLPPHILNAPIPPPPPIPTGPNVPDKTIAAYTKCNEIHFSGAGGHRAPIPCIPCQKAPDKIHSCVVNSSVGNGLICNHCAQKKEKCSFQMDEEARIIRETGVDMGPNMCQRCRDAELAQHRAGNLGYRAECYQAPVGLRAKRSLGSACSGCIFVGKKESCSLNETPRKRNHKFRDMIED